MKKANTMKHGGDLRSYQHLYDGELVDFSSNINPLGYPKILDDMIPTKLSTLTAYPDIQYRALRQSLGEYLGCPANEVIVGNGSVDILDHFCRKAQRIITCLPCFGEYLDRPAIYGTPLKKLSLPEDFRVSATRFYDAVSAGDVVILGNPNNPTGLRIQEAELVRIQELTEQHGAHLLLDEAFAEFCPEDYDSIRLFAGKSNVCVLRAATKFFGLPGIRLGYAWTAPDVVESYNAAALPWRINALADLAGQVIFRQTDYIRKTKQYIHEQRQQMLSQLRGIPGLHVYPTDTNFILLKLLSSTEDEVFTRIIRQGLLIRKASSFEGLDHTYIRIAIKDEKNNARLLEALKKGLP